MEELTRRVARWSQSLATGGTAPSLIAGDIRQVADNWDQMYRSDCGDMTCSSWFRKVIGPGRGLNYYVDLAGYLDDIGQIGKKIHFASLYWVCNRVEDAEIRRKCVEKLFLYQKRKGALASPAAAKREVADLIGWTCGHSRQCGECVRLRKILRAHGISDE